ncbi:S-adenosyl-L-methionine-dependent methyltransferase [Xylaria sp. FL0933]|nr:S-adenosyl-L-methionine-dependent methyltransferase [Xylaria sp. FL0933]
MTTPSLKDRTIEAFWGLVRPWLFLSLSASYLPATLRTLFTTHSLPTSLSILLLSPSRFRSLWFGHFWAYAGPQVRESAAPKVLPLLDGRVSGGRVLDTPAAPGIGGVVIEIGAATGLYVEVFSDRHLYEDSGRQVEGRKNKKKRANTARSAITRVYGVEPNPAHHAALRRAVEAAGLQDVYEIVPVGIEDLCSSSSSSSSSSSFSSSDNGGGKGKKEKEKAEKKWDGNIAPQSVDCIVSILCLCSIPDPQRHIRELYELLRPGGRWYVYEHVKARNMWYIRLYQRIINVFWPRFIGGCELCRPTEKTITETGPWSKIDVGQPVDEQWYGTVPHVLGIFTK